MMRVHFLVEGRSEAAFFDRWAPRLLKGHEVRTHPHQGKGTLPKPGEKLDPRRRGLLDQLPAKLRGFGGSTRAKDECVVVVVDADDEDCVALRERLDEAIEAISPKPVVLLRIAVEELEAYYLGDLHALGAAYPKHDAKAARAYVPDSIVGTAELFGKIIGDGGANKVAWAERMGDKLGTKAAVNRSPSFKKLVSGLRRVIAPPPPKKRGRR